MKDIEFSALLCSRLCHDLISPVGAIANGLEILSDEDDDMMRTEVMKLLGQSAEVTSSRLKFYRLCFGSAGGFGEKVPLSEAENAVKGLYDSGNINLVWNSEVYQMSKDAMKAMLNMVLLAGEGLIRGGDINLEIKQDDQNINISITVQGDKVIFPDNIKDALLNKISQDAIEAKTAPAFLAANVAEALGTSIEYDEHNEQGFSLKLSYQEAE